MLDRALAVTEVIQGAKVFRLKPGTKEPMARGWQEESTSELEEIEALWSKRPTANIGIDCEKSELIVVDVDNGLAKDGHRKQGDASYAELTGRNGGHTPTLTVRTWSGGYHHYYRAPEGNSVPSSVSKIAKDIDIRATGGLVVAPGSVFEGVEYEIVNDMAVAVCPQWIFEEMAKIDAARAPRRELSADALAKGEGLAGFDESVEHARYLLKAAALAPETQGNDTFSKTAFNLGCMTRYGQFGDDFDFAWNLCVVGLERAMDGWTFNRERDRIGMENTIRSQFNAGFDKGTNPWLSRAYMAASRAKAVATETVASAATTEGTEAGASPSPTDTVPTAGPRPIEATPCSTPFSEYAVERELPPPSQPDDVARELIGVLPNTDGAPHFRSHDGALYAWNGLKWEQGGEARLRGMIRAAATRALYVGLDKKGNEVVYPWAPTTGKVYEVLASFTDYLYLSDIAPSTRSNAFLNGILNEDTGELEPHSPRSFNLGHLGFDYDPGAECPLFLSFLESILPGDRQAVELLQEWFGYVISGRLDQQKALALIGPPRCGKGTLSKILKELVGMGCFVTPRLNGMSGTFGLQPFIGKTLAIFEDVRWNGVNGCESELLSITAGDSSCVARKNTTSWDGVLPSRLVFISNDAPTFSDPSGALPGRLVTISIKQSFLGREDTTLGARLVAEMPGIYNWAVAGLRRLERNGRFTVPESSRSMVESIRELSSPVAAFVDEQCELGDDFQVDLAELFGAYRQWCVYNNQNAVSQQLFGRQLRSAIYGLPDRRRVRIGNRVASIQAGIRVLPL